ncbi:MAG: hypothetical protein EKK46_10320 [Rhodocyclaceae bacterium]|nr:MAG: hypothetical protein EKK46_10320 [Rhodocyclaceae bacterium]
MRGSAQFRVTNDVVNSDVSPFTATINGFGNTLITEGGGFEPVVFRYKFMATEDAPNRIVADPMALTRYDTLREGFLDGAAVRVFRVEGGRMRLAREDTVAPGGAHASGWVRAMDDNQVVAADKPRFVFRWDAWNRPNAPYYFTVRAVDRAGNLSAIAPPITVLGPEKPGKTPAPANALLPFKATTAPFLGRASAPAAPKNLRARLGGDGLLILEWETSSGPDLAGYVVYRSDYPPEKHSGYYLQLTGSTAPGQAIRAGDMVIVSKKLYTASRNRDLSNRVWGAANEYSLLMPGLLGFFPDEAADKHWALVPHDPATPVEEAGETCLRLTLGPGVKESLSLYNHSGTGQSWYEVLEKTTYKMEVWLRQEGSGSVRFKLTGFYDSPPQKIEPTVFNVGNGWKKYVARFTPPTIQEGDRPNTMALEFTGPGTFYVDNFRVYRADTPFMDLLPRELDAIRSSGMSALRTHGLARTFIHTYDMAQLTNPGGVISGTGKLNTLPQTLRAMKAAGVQPWLQVEFHMSPQEWLGLIEYLAAPYDPAVDTPVRKPWAYKRYRQGQSRPWTEEFDKVYFELSNETWNGLFSPWTFPAMRDAASDRNYSPGQVYGLYQEYVRGVMAGSPYWQSAGLNKKLAFVLGGWAANMGYSHDAAAASPSSDYLAIAAYNGGWDEAEGPPKFDAASLFDTLSNTVQSALPVAERYAQELRALNKARGDHPLRLATYEAGPGYALNGLNGAHVSETQQREQEQVMKSLAAGTATLDAFLARAYRGFSVQNFFTFDAGPLWKSHAKWYHGGQAYPSWKLLSLFNQEAAGPMLRTETLNVPTAELKGYSRRQTVKDAPLAAIYATRREDRFSLVVVSRKVADYPLTGDDGYTPVTVQLPFAKAKSLTLYRMTGPARSNNLLTDNVKVEQVELPVPDTLRTFNLNDATGADSRGLPPASTYLYVFEGVAGGVR